MNFRLIALGLFFGVGIAASAIARVSLPPLFSDGAVLQRDHAVAIWGAATPGERVHVQFGAFAAEAVTAADGRWQVSLPALPASATPVELVVKGENIVRIKNVVVGEVWLCAGQSNMNFRLSRSKTAAQDIPQAHFPLIRQIEIATGPADTPHAVQWSGWIETTPETARLFSAIGHYFGRELYEQLGVPVGIIKNAAAGTMIETWLSPAALAADPALAVAWERWRAAEATFAPKKARYTENVAKWEADAAAAKTEGKSFTRSRPSIPAGSGPLAMPGGFFESKVRPLLAYTIRGILWYQGESNMAQPQEYQAFFLALIRQWRADFQQGELPFFYVQLPNYEAPADKTGMAWAQVRAGQTAALTLPNTAMAVTIDLGDPKDLHPHNKRDVAHRLALLARAKVYGEKVACESPSAVGFEKAGNAFRVRLRDASGLHLRDGKAGGAEIAGGDRVFHPATIRVEGESLVLSSSDVPVPVAVRYAWSNAPEASLYNGAGLPVIPFRSDDW